MIDTIDFTSMDILVIIYIILCLDIYLYNIQANSIDVKKQYQNLYRFIFKVIKKK